MPKEGDVELFSSLSFHNIYLMQFNSSGLLAALRILLSSSQGPAILLQLLRAWSFQRSLQENLPESTSGKWVFSSLRGLPATRFQTCACGAQLRNTCLLLSGASFQTPPGPKGLNLGDETPSHILSSVKNASTSHIKYNPHSKNLCWRCF